MREIKREPLGIRKLDVQAARRATRKTNKAEANQAFESWFDDGQRHSQPMALTRANIVRAFEVMLSNGWEEGVKVGAQATRDRVAESLANGRLIKVDD